jgi:hypothetical protein
VINRLTAFVVLLVSAAACGGDSGRKKTDAPLPPDVVSYDGYKSIIIGMRPNDPGVTSNPKKAACRFAAPANYPAGVRVMLVNDTAVRIDVDSGGIATPAGIFVGDPESKVMERYKDAILAPHKYVAGGRYIIVTSPVDSMRRGIFETDGAKVLRYRFGRRPEVDFVEGCG